MQSRRVSLPALMLTVVGMLAGLLVTAPAAEATSSILCQGFAGCVGPTYSNFGYAPSNYKKMWWRMYSGHNCTNYVSYRMIQAGMPTQRPWSSSGDARNWGVVFRSKTNQTPMVGSVAWWSSNHVAYVQQIIDANTIVISEDHYGGDFDWRKIVRSGGGWPTGFIHLADETIKPTAPPTVIGTPQVDQALTVKPGTWNQKGATYRYQWLAAGTPVTGATLPRYTPTAAQVGDAFTVKVIAAKAGYKAGSTTSSATVPTAPGVMAVTGVPVISGVPKVAAVLTATVPTWTPVATSMSYAWFADGTLIPGSNATSFTVQPAQLGKKLTFVSTGLRDGYTNAAATSGATAPIGPEKLTVTEEPTLVGNPHVGVPITATSGQVTPAATTSYQWFRDGTAISGARAATYTPTVDDQGTHLSVDVSYTRPGYTTIVRELAPKHAVRSYAWISAKSTSHRTVTITVRAAGVPVVHGDVMLAGPHGSSITVHLVHGQATFSPSWLRAGSRTLTITFLGSYRVEATSRTRTVQVR